MSTGDPAPLSLELAHAANRLGALLGAGKVSWEACQHIASIWTADAAPAHPHAMQARLCWRMADTATAYAQAREAAEWRVRRAVRPLLRDGATKAAVEEAAGRAADGSPLDWPEIYPILHEEKLRATRR